jgi:SAM-dependent methyltransferase
MAPDQGGSGHESPWEQYAGWWQQNFTEGADAEYSEQILPLVAAELGRGTRVLDVGTGEGQVARLVAGSASRGRSASRHGRMVVGADPSRAQLSEAARRGGGPRYVRAEAGTLPFASGSFDTVVACLVFEHITDVDAVMGEVARVMRPRGRFLFLLNHPLLQTPGSGWIDDRILDEQYWRIGPYLVEDESLEEVDKGIFIPFVHRPLSRYVNAMAGAGLLVTRMEEPAPPPGFLARAAEYVEAERIPRLLYLRAEKRGVTRRG